MAKISPVNIGDTGTQALTKINTSLASVDTANITNDAVTLDKVQNAVANDKLLGSGDAGSGNNYSEITLGTNLSMSGTTLNAADANTTNLGYTASAANGVVTSDTGTNATIPLSTPTGGSNAAGLLSPGDKDKLDATSGTNTGDQTITLTGQATGSGSGSFAVTLTNDAVIDKTLKTGYTPGAGTVAVGDSVQEAIQKLDGNINNENLWDRSGSDLSPANVGDTVTADGGLTVGTGAAGVDYAITFDGETNDGTITHMEDENRFDFSTEVNIPASSSYKINDTAIVSDSAGTATLSNIDALDATTETTVEGAIDALPNLSTVQSQSVSLSGSLTVSSAATVSGTNTGDQTITLTGDVTGSGTGSFAATIAADSVTNAKLADMAANTVKVNNTGSAVNPVDLTMGNSTFLGRTSASAIKAMSVTETKTELGAGSANGLATLDGSGRIPNTQLPTTVVEYLGTWNASTNTPTLADGSGTSGDEYYVNVAGTQDLGSGSQTFGVGDVVRYNGAIWQQLNNNSDVTSVFSRTGAIVSANGDYTAAQVTNVPSGSVSSTTVQAAIDELESEKQPLDSGLTSISGLTTAADTMIYTTALDTYATSSLTSFARTILDDADASAVRTTIGALNQVVEDTTPQLGGMLDVNGNSIGDGTLELLTFVETVSAVNHIQITNAATGNAAKIGAVGDDAAVSLNLTSKGAGIVQINGNRAISFGAGEINTLTEKSTPVDGDIIIIEDSADSNNKKKVQLANLISNTSVEAKTNGSASPYAILTTDDQKVFTNEGATEEVYLTLPTAVAGLEFAFVCQDANGIRITSNTGDTIRSGISVSAAAGNIKTFSVGNTIRLLAINATEWIDISARGDGAWEVT